VLDIQTILTSVMPQELLIQSHRIASATENRQAAVERWEKQIGLARTPASLLSLPPAAVAKLLLLSA
jgi:hypothetical protein